MVPNKVKTRLACCLLLLCPLVAIVIKFGSEYIASSSASKEATEMNRSFAIIIEAINSYNESNKTYPYSLTILNIPEKLPLSLHKFNYSCSNGVWSLSFSGKYVAYSCSSPHPK